VASAIGLFPGRGPVDLIQVNSWDDFTVSMISQLQLHVSDRRTSAIELVVVLLLLEVCIWIGASHYYYRLLAGAMLAVVGLYSIVRQRHDIWKTSKPPWSTLTSWIVIIAITCALAAGAVLGAEIFYAEGEKFRWGRLERFLGWKALLDKALIVVIQQVLLYRFLFPLLFNVFGSRGIAFGATAVVFGVLHLPSVFLVGLTTAMAVIWLYLYERSRRLGPLIICHFVLAVVASGVLPERLTYNLAVGQNALPLVRSYERLAEDKLAAKYDELKSNVYYEKSGGTDRSFIIALYRDVLHRSPAEMEIAPWLLALDRRNRAEVVREFLDSKEFRARCGLQQECD